MTELEKYFGQFQTQKFYINLTNTNYDDKENIFIGFTCLCFPIL